MIYHQWHGTQDPAEHRQHWLNDVLDELLSSAPDESGHTERDKPGEDTGHDEVDLDAPAEQLVAETIAELDDDVEPMTEEEVAEAVAIVRRQLQEEMTS